MLGVSIYNFPLDLRYVLIMQHFFIFEFVLNYFFRNKDVILKILLPAGSSWYFWT